MGDELLDLLNYCCLMSGAMYLGLSGYGAIDLVLVGHGDDVY